MPAPYRIADVIETIATYHMDLFGGQDLQPGFDPTSHHGHLTVEEAGLNHSAILPSKIWLMPAIVTTGRDFSTNRPAYGLFVWRQDVRPGS